MDFKEVNVQEYVEHLFKQGKKSVKFFKSTPVYATKATTGQIVETFVKNKETGELIKETEKVAKSGEWFIVNKGKEAYLISSQTFHKFYGVSEEEGQRIPIKTPRTLIQIDENISFVAPWGEKMKIQSGGWLNIDDLSNIYGINPIEFEETHSPYDE